MSGLVDFYVGIPLLPVDYWRKWHFFYWWGLATPGFNFTDRTWVSAGDTLFTLEDIEIYSPYEGEVIGYEIRCRYPVAKVSRYYESDSFFIMRPTQASYKPDIGSAYSSLQNYIVSYAEARRPGGIRGWLSNVGTVGLDPKKRFSGFNQLLEKAKDLENIQSVRIDRVREAGEYF